MSRIKRHKNTFLALSFLMEIELNMLEEIQQRIKKPGDHRNAQFYVSKFSAKRISKGKNNILITKHMFEEYLGYLRWSDSYKYYIDNLKEEIEKINSILNDYLQIRKAFR
jgi:hypothetical protein